MYNITTSDLSKFGSRERKMLEDILKAWREQGLPVGFYDDEVTPMMNLNSGHVFLTNSEYQAAMMNGDRLELWYVCSACGNEGFLYDLDSAIRNNNDCPECIRVAKLIKA